MYVLQLVFHNSLPVTDTKKKKVKKNAALDREENKKKWEKETKERKARTVFVGNVALKVKKKVHFVITDITTTKTFQDSVMLVVWSTS